MYKSRARPNGSGASDKASPKDAEKHVVGSLMLNPPSSATEGDEDDDDGLRREPPPAISLFDLPPTKTWKDVLSTSHSPSSEKVDHDEYTIGGDGDIQVVLASESHTSTLHDEEAADTNRQVEEHLPEDRQESNTKKGPKGISKKSQKTTPEKSEGSQEEEVKEMVESDSNRDEPEEDTEGAKKPKKRRSSRLREGEVSDAIHDVDKAPKTKKAKAAIEKGQAEAVQAESTSNEVECWVEMFYEENTSSVNKRKREELVKDGEDEESDELADESSSKTRTKAKVAKRVPLAEKSTNIKPVSPSSSTSSRKQVKKPAAASKNAKKSSKAKTDPKQEVSEKKTSRQKDLENRLQAPKSQVKLALPKKFEQDCKIALQNCVDDERQWMAADNLFMMLDLFEYYNDSALNAEPKGKRLKKMSRTLDYHVGDTASMHRSLVRFQQRIMLWLAGEDEDSIQSKSSGMDKKQAQEALHLMVQYVADKGPKDRWQQLRDLRDFKVKSIAQLQAKFETLISSIDEALEDEELKP